MDWLDLLAVQRTLKSLLQHHRSKASILWCSFFFFLIFYCSCIFIYFCFFFFKFDFIFKLYNIVLVLPNIKMNPPQVHIRSPSWTLFPPPSPHHPSGSSQCTSPKHPVSCIEPGLATCFIHDITHVSMPFSQIFPPSPSPTVHKTVIILTIHWKDWC